MRPTATRPTATRPTATRPTATRPTVLARLKGGIALAALGLMVAAPTHAAPADPQAVLATYATIAERAYADALRDAISLQTALHALADAPSDATLTAARDAWRAARESYGPTEVFRLSGGPIDAEEGWVAETYGGPESQINAWPLDENMIDYTLDADGKRTSGNIIDTAGPFTPAGEGAAPVDAAKLTPETLTALNENGGDANVASGYHAIEFLLWGQDQDYGNMIADTVTPGAMVAGERPLTDFTTDAHAARRLAYLTAAGDKLVADLTAVSDAWAPKVEGTRGLYRAALLGQAGEGKDIAPADAVRQILAGVGVFSKSELANERIAVAVLTPSEEDEHSCFSDNTHRDIDRNYAGIRNVLRGEYAGEKVGPSFLDAAPAEVAADIDTLLGKIDGAVAKIDETARTTMHFDYQIRPENEASVQTIVTLKNDLRKLGDKMTKVAPAFGVSLTQDDVTDPEETKVE